MIGIAHLADGRHTLHVYQPYLTRRQADLCKAPFLRQELGRGTGGADQLATLPDVELDIVDDRPDRNTADWQRIAQSNLGSRTRHHCIAYHQAHRREHVPLLTISIHDQRNPRRPVRIVFDGRHTARYAQLVTLKIYGAEAALMASAPVPDGNLAPRVASGVPLQLAHQ
jgi:hypothetical protein